MESRKYGFTVWMDSTGEINQCFYGCTVTLLEISCNLFKIDLQKRLWKKGKSDISWGPDIVGVVPLHARSFGRRFCLVKDAFGEGCDPRTSRCVQLYNELANDTVIILEMVTWNGQWAQETDTTNDFKLRLKQFLLNHFNLQLQ